MLRLIFFSVHTYFSRCCYFFLQRQICPWRLCKDTNTIRSTWYVYWMRIKITISPSFFWFVRIFVVFFCLVSLLYLILLHLRIKDIVLSIRHRFATVSQQQISHSTWTIFFGAEIFFLHLDIVAIENVFNDMPIFNYLILMQTVNGNEAYATECFQSVFFVSSTWSWKSTKRRDDDIETSSRFLNIFLN